MDKFWGKIRRHNQRGKSLGFPTANINLAKNIPEGIYISKTRLGNLVYPALTFIGSAKTFNEKKFQAETYILDFNKNLYGKWISVELLKKIRNNKKFNSAKELIARMKKDEQEAREHFSHIKMNSTNFQKGFIHFLIIFGILTVILTTLVVFYNNPTSSPSNIPQYAQSLSPAPISQKVFSIVIKGDSNCVSQTEQALNLLKEKSNIHNAAIIKYVGIIECSDSGSGMYT